MFNKKLVEKLIIELEELPVKTNDNIQALGATYIIMIGEIENIEDVKGFAVGMTGYFLGLALAGVQSMRSSLN